MIREGAGSEEGYKGRLRLTGSLTRVHGYNDEVAYSLPVLV